MLTPLTDLKRAVTKGSKMRLLQVATDPLASRNILYKNQVVISKASTRLGWKVMIFGEAGTRAITKS